MFSKQYLERIDDMSITLFTRHYATAGAWRECVFLSSFGSANDDMQLRVAFKL